MKKTITLVALFLFLCISNSYSQVELVSPVNPVYNFLQRMHTLELIPDYNPGNIPISRAAIASFLKIINDNPRKTTNTDKQLLKLNFNLNLPGI